MDALGENPAFWTLVVAPLAGLMVALRQRAPAPVPTLAPILALLLLALPWLLDRMIDTPRERLGREVEGLREAAFRRDSEAVVGFLAAEFRNRELDRAALANAIREEFRAVEVGSLKFNNRRLEVNGDTATVAFVLTFSGKYRQQPIEYYPMRLKLHFRREGQRWLITNVQRFELAGGEKEISLRVR